jgi:hypothetical protein
MEIRRRNGHMTEENSSSSEGRPQAPHRKSPWVTIGKVLRYVFAAGALLVLLVFGTCLLLFMK